MAVIGECAWGICASICCTGDADLLSVVAYGLYEWIGVEETSAEEFVS